MTLAELVRRRAAQEGDRVAFSFVADGTGAADSLTWSQLHKRASALAARILSSGGAKQPVLLTLPRVSSRSSSRCSPAGTPAIAVPVCMPRHQRVKHRLDRIFADVGARFAIGGDDVRKRLQGDDAAAATIGEIVWIDANSSDEADMIPRSDPGDIAVLQYTSGSTGRRRKALWSRTAI